MLGDLIWCIKNILDYGLMLILFLGHFTTHRSEFSNPKAIEEPDMLSGLKTRVFYCDAGKPYQKGAIEVNHELIRRILPKGASFDQLTQMISIYDESH